MLAVRCSRSRLQSGFRAAAALNTTFRLSPTAHWSRHQIRGNNTQAGSDGTGSVGTYAFMTAAAAAVGGLVGYYLACPALSENTNDRPVRLNDQYGTPKDFQDAIRELQQALPGENMVSTEPDVLKSRGLSIVTDRQLTQPTVVVSPLSTEDVVKIVNISRKYRMPIVVHSGGTSLENHLSMPPCGGICVDVSGMDKVLEIHEDDSDMICQPGVGWIEINEMLKEKGIPLFFPLDPAPGATLGGMLACGCSGTNAVRYGTARGEWFLNATVVLPSGEVIKTRRRSRKSSAGPDMTKLFIGSEGTLGIVTELTIRLAPVLPTRVAVVQFPDVYKATKAAVEILNHGVGLQCIELCDSVFMHATNTYGKSRRKYAQRDSLFFKLQGPSPASLDETAAVVKRVAEKYGATGFEYARGEEEAEELWMDRKMAFFSGKALKPEARALGTDVCVPVSRLPDLVYETKKDLEASGLIAPIVGHVGDGNFHAMILFNDDQYPLAKDIVERMVHRAIALDGTCTGEHGVGLGKRKYLYEELGEGTVEFMKMLKKTIDPLNLFNPGKLYPDPLERKGK